MARETELHDDDAIATRLAALGGSEEEEATEGEVVRDTPSGDEGAAADGDDESAETNEEPDEGADEEPEGTEAAGPSTLDEVAKAFQVEPDEFLKTVQVAGVDGKLVPLAEIVSHFRRDAAARELPAQLHAQRAEYETLRAKVEQDRTQGLAELKAAIGANIKHLKAAQNVDWDTLREENPLEYAVKRQDLAEQQAAAERGVAMIERERERRDRDENAGREKWYGEERVKLLSARPDWTEPAALQGAINTVAGYLTTKGFDPNDQAVVDLVMDHRILQIVHKAAEFDALAKKSEKTLSQVRRLPKLVRPEARNEERGRGVGRMKQARAQLHKRGDVDSLAAALGEMGG